MPRSKGFGGFGDDRTEDEAFNEGRRESRKSSSTDDIFKDLGEFPEKVAKENFGDGRTSQEKAYDAGWEKGRSDRGSYSASSSRSSDYHSKVESKGGGFDLQGCFYIVAFIGFTIFALYESFYNPDPVARQGAFYCSIPGILLGAVFLLIFLLPRRR